MGVVSILNGSAYAEYRVLSNFSPVSIIRILKSDFRGIIHGTPRKLNRLECLLPPFFACMRFGFLNFFVKQANRLYAFHLFTGSPLGCTFT